MTFVPLSTRKDCSGPTSLFHQHLTNGHQISEDFPDPIHGAAQQGSASSTACGTGTPLKNMVSMETTWLNRPFFCHG